MLNRVDQWHFDNSFVRELPADPEAANFRRNVEGAAYSTVTPAIVAAPTLAAHSPEVAELLDLSPSAIADRGFAEVMAGNVVLDGSVPFAMAYAGHQFGSFAGQLGDGRAIALGEVITQHAGRQMLQLKGAGPTPYSRGADGLAVLRSSIREFLCSEAMHHLGVPTTRALSLVTTGEQVMRDMFYDGRPGFEPGAVVCRVAPTFIRFGNFELASWRGDIDLLRQLADHTITHHFSHLSEVPNPQKYLDWFVEIRDRTAFMIAEWMRVGFVHGVMNTDNMSILGLTIDYGPYGWLEDFDPGWTPNTTDAARKRYRYGAQPQIAHWNLMRLANALVPLIDDVEALQAALDGFTDVYGQLWTSVVNAKLGLGEAPDDEVARADAGLVDGVFSLLQRRETDMTIFLRQLSDLAVADITDAGTDADIAALVGNALYQPLGDSEADQADQAAIATWLRQWAERVAMTGTDADRQASMRATNPKYVLRNYLAQVAIDRATGGDMSEIETLLDVLRHPYDDQPGRDDYAAKRPEWARERAGCSMLSCSS